MMFCAVPAEGTTRAFLTSALDYGLGAPGRAGFASDYVGTDDPVAPVPQTLYFFS